MSVPTPFGWDYYRTVDDDQVADALAARQADRPGVIFTVRRNPDTGRINIYERGGEPLDE